jgi:hypothetical protein
MTGKIINSFIFSYLTAFKTAFHCFQQHNGFVRMILENRSFAASASNPDLGGLEVSRWLRLVST